MSNIHGLGNINRPGLPERKTTTKAKSAATGKKESRQDTVEVSAGKEQMDTGVYVRSRVNGKLVQSLMDEQQAQADRFRRSIQSMIARQGEQSNLSLFGYDLFVTPEDSARAAEAIAPGGEYSVEAVADRIMNMAQALCGGDTSKIGLLRDAVEKGFKAAGVELGGKLPQISTDTYNEVMERFDQWAKEAAGE